MMNKLFRKKLTRGGFTLAELLIVVAILAILVAVAIPIFTNSVEQAQIATLKSGVRAVRAVAIKDILMSNGGGEYTASKEGWTVKAEVTQTGEVKLTEIKACGTTKPASFDEGVAAAAGGAFEDPNGASYKPTVNPSKGYFVQVLIKENEVSVTPA